jgi:lipopolysaccharide export system protein LptC
MASATSPRPLDTGELEQLFRLIGDADSVELKLAVPESDQYSCDSDALQVALDTQAFLTERAVDLTGKQQTKTKTALRYFSKNLASAS